MKCIALRYLLAAACLLLAGGRVQAQIDSRLVNRHDDDPPQSGQFSPSEPLAVQKTAQRGVVFEPGGSVPFKIKLHNEGASVLTIVSLEDRDQDGVIQLPNEPPATLAPGAQWESRYLGVVSGSAGDIYTNTVTVVAKDGAREFTIQDQALVRIKSNKKPDRVRLELENDVCPWAVREPGGDVQYKLRLRNAGQTPLKNITLVDKLDGVVLALPSDYPVPTTLAAGAEWEAIIRTRLTGKAGDVRKNVAVAEATDNSGKEKLREEAVSRVLILPAKEADGDIVKNAQIGDRVWVDQNRDGIQTAGEPGLPGVVIRLRACENNKVLGETRSGDNGQYEFKGDFPSPVYLAVTLPEGYAFALRKAGTDPKLDSDIDPATGKSKRIELDSENESIDPAKDWDIGLVARIPGSAYCGVRGVGYWKNHLEAWPVPTLTIGGITYSKEQAAMKFTNGSDKSYALFATLAAALLNQAAGAPTASIAEAMQQANQWLASNPPGSGVRPNHGAWRDLGAKLNEILEQYNEGKSGVVKEDETSTPASVNAGIVARNEDHKPAWLQLRVNADKGRTVILQKSSNLKDWEDVEVLENPLGVSESLRAEIASDPKAFYRVVFPDGPAAIQDERPSSTGIVRQLESNEQIVLPPLVYKGSVLIVGNDNVLAGSTPNAKVRTVITGDLIIKGNLNLVSDLTVLGNIILEGNNNELRRVDYEGKVKASGKDNLF